MDTWVEHGASEILKHYIQGDTEFKKGCDELLEPKILNDKYILKNELINLCKKYRLIENDGLAPLKLNAGIWRKYTIEDKKSRQARKEQGSNRTPKKLANESSLI